MGYHLLLLVYEKTDDHTARTATLDFVRCAFVDESRTGDYGLTRVLLESLNLGANQEDIFAILSDRNLPGDEIQLTQLSAEILTNPPIQGYLTISNALQWRLQYGRVVELAQSVEGITNLV